MTYAEHVRDEWRRRTLAEHGGCACPSHDAYDCMRFRHSEVDLSEEVGPCECMCHAMGGDDDA